MSELTRRGLLGMFAAGVASAVLPSGIIMPIRKIISQPLEWVVDDVMYTQPFSGGVWFDASDMTGMFQDAAGTVPVSKLGDTVACWRSKVGSPLLFSSHAVWTRDPDGRPYIALG